MFSYFRNRRKNNHKGTNRALQPSSPQSSSIAVDVPTQAVMYSSMMNTSNTETSSSDSSYDSSSSSDSSYDSSSSSDSSSSYSSDY